jgi:hypothetical protein
MAIKKKIDIMPRPTKAEQARAIAQQKAYDKLKTIQKEQARVADRKATPSFQSTSRNYIQSRIASKSEKDKLSLEKARSRDKKSRALKNAGVKPNAKPKNPMGLKKMNLDTKAKKK